MSGEEKQASGFHSTYEELKPIRRKSGIVPSSFVFILPMRNWNLEDCIENAYTWNTVFILPMRNWNEVKSLRPGIWTGVFILPMRNWNRQWTANLKRMEFMFSFYLWGIETFVQKPVPRQTQSVFILPMRNWNAMAGWLFYWRHKFSFYLWGIETSFGGRMLASICLFSFYLWGIETGFLETTPGNAIEFSFYLWGIETEGHLFLPWILHRFHSTYEELKPPCACE